MSGALSPAEVRHVADGLLAAYRTRTPVAPVIATHPGATIDDAYRIQQAQVDAWRADGAVVTGHKIGLVSPAIQRQMGVYEPDYGHLTDSMFLLESAPVPPERFLQPRVEPELAFVLRAALRGPGVGTADAARAVDHVRPALEVVDSRIRDWNLSIVDTVADNASSGGVVFGATRFGIDELDPTNVRCSMWRNGTHPQRGTGRAVLGNPLHAVAWLANALGRHGVLIEAGHVVLSGSMTAAVPVHPGDTVVADFGEAGQVTLTIGQTAPPGARQPGIPG